jgi:type III pantothenate kinase
MRAVHMDLFESPARETAAGVGTLAVLLALDVGNTNIHLGVFRGPELLAHWDISNNRDRTADELALLLAQLFGSRGFNAAALRGAAVASVVPMVTGTICTAVRRFIGVEPFVLGPGADTGIAVRYDDPREVGADRIANAVGGFSKYGGPLIVVDFGTATTFDAIAADGTYLGGAIAPGLRISIEALSQRAARLPRIELVRPGVAIGANTAASMQAGIIFGYAGLVEALVGRISREIGGSPGVVATGGLAELIVRETGAVTKVDQHLTLEGLRLLWERNGER